jgi:reactive intermediate/imine deaminase|tara:strand:- start:3383 stop:3760 length:378 start_codon:yes stop_codon:yes gene_type:complete
MKKKIETSNAPSAIGPYSQAIISGNNIYLSGQIPLDPKTMKIVEGEENQIRRVFDNIQAVCKAAECSLNDIVKLNVSLQDLSIFSKVNEIMLEYFEEPYPARAALQVAKLPLDSLIEVEAIIIKD